MVESFARNNTYSKVAGWAVVLSKSHSMIVVHNYSDRG